jgi:hypothetical protein
MRIADCCGCVRRHRCNVLGGAGNLSVAAQSQYRDHRACGSRQCTGHVSRLLQRLLQEKRLTSASISVVNKTGGGNAVGFTYLASHAGDAHYVAVTPLTIITNRIVAANAINYHASWFVGAFAPRLLVALSPDGDVTVSCD